MFTKKQEGHRIRSKIPPTVCPCNKKFSKRSQEKSRWINSTKSGQCSKTSENSANPKSVLRVSNWRYLLANCKRRSVGKTSSHDMVGGSDCVRVGVGIALVGSRVWWF